MLLAASTPTASRAFSLTAAGVSSRERRATKAGGPLTLHSSSRAAGTRAHSPAKADMLFCCTAWVKVSDLTSGAKTARRLVGGSPRSQSMHTAKAAAAAVSGLPRSWDNLATPASTPPLTPSISAARSGEERSECRHRICHVSNRCASPALCGAARRESFARLRAWRGEAVEAVEADCATLLEWLEALTQLRGGKGRHHDNTVRLHTGAHAKAPQASW